MQPTLLSVQWLADWENNLQITLDLFPCNVIAAPANFVPSVHDLEVRPPHEGATFLEVCRVLIADDNLVIAMDAPNGAQIVFQEPVAELFLGTKPEHLTRVVTVKGKLLAFYKDNGCGCSSRLRSWNPYKTLMSTKG